MTIIHQLTFSTFAIVLLMFTLLRLRHQPTVTHGIITGTVLGITTLIIPAVLYFAPFIPLWLLVRYYRSELSFQRTAKLIVLIIGVTMMIVLPWTIRNYLVHDRFILMKLVGWNFWRGILPPAIHTDVPNNLNDAPPAIQRRVKGMSEAAADAFLLHRPLQYVLKHPIDFVVKFIQNIWDFWWFPPVQDHQQAQVNLLRQLVYAPVPVTGILGIVASLKQWARDLPLYFIFIAFTVGYSIFLILPRYRVPTIQPFLIMFAGYGSYQILKRGTKRLKNTSAMSGRNSIN